MLAVVLTVTLMTLAMMPVALFIVEMQPGRQPGKAHQHEQRESVDR